MYRLNYNWLDKKQVEAVLAKATAPVCASKFCGRLAGKTLKVILDKTPVAGPVLEYEFKSDTKLTLKENGAAAVECDYGALTLKDITLFSHMVPGTKKGYTVIVNWATTVVTAYEMWFLDIDGKPVDTSKIYYEVFDAAKLAPFVNREVQRQYYFGYFEEAGKTPPAQRDKISMRLENTMLEWNEDRGKRRLSTYTSTTYTTMVELDTPDGGDVLTFPSDILQINNSTFIYCFGEIEYSGRLSIEVLDLYSMKKIGMTMGIDENDTFEHTLYKGCGKFLGRYSVFFDFNDPGDQYSTATTSRIDFSVKGTRATYRPSVMTKLQTEEDLKEAAKAPQIFDKERHRGMMGTMASSNTLDDTGYLVGKSVTFRGDDGLAVEMRFNTIEKLEYRLEGDTSWNTEVYSAQEIDEDLISVGYYRSGSYPPENYIFAFDFKNGCATCLSSTMGSKYDLHDPVPHYHFGVIETDGVTPLRIFRHGFTNELLGRAYTQSYSSAMSSIHIYNAPHSYSWTIINAAEPGSPGNRAGGAVWSSPCEYIKLRDDVYIMSWVEQKWSGHMDTLFRNLRTGRDGGYAYGITYDGKAIFMDKMGSVSRAAGKIDLTGVYSLGSYNVLA